MTKSLLVLNVGNDLISDHRALESQRVYTSVHFQYPNGANAERTLSLGCFPASGTFNQNVKKARHQEVGQLCSCLDKNNLNGHFKSKRTKYRVFYVHHVRFKI